MKEIIEWSAFFIGTIGTIFGGNGWKYKSNQLEG